MRKPTNAELERWTDETHELMEQTGVTKTPRAQVRLLRERGAKRCPGCSTVLRLEEFAAKKSNSDGLQPRCRACSGTDFRKFYNRDPQAQVQRVNKYRESNPLTVRISNGRIRAKEFGVPWEDFNKDDLLAYWSSVGIDPWVSVYSGVPLTPENFSIDHVRPLSQPGTPGHRKEMLVPCSQAENRRKGTGHWIHLLSNKPDPNAPELVKQALEPSAPRRARRTLLLQTTAPKEVTTYD